MPATLDLRCPACLGPGRPRSLVVEGRFRLLSCTVCDTQYFRADGSLPVDDGPEEAAEASTDSAYWEQYKFEVYADRDVQAEYERRYDALIPAAERIVGPVRRVLDIGCGIGNFVEYAARTRAAFGTDVEPRAVEQARVRGLQVALPDDVEAMLGDEPLDAITLWDVIEHVFDPDDMLAGALPRLRPGGAVVLETPDARFLPRSLLLGMHRASRGRVDLTSPMYYWEHKIYFSEEGLRRLLARHGCTLREVQRWTSPRAKMSTVFAEHSGRPLHAALALAWPALEGVTRRLGRGNKLLVVATKD